jgi:acetylornithine deacetylase/succinyl-diaminopimelate desuccinylase-like protein
MALDIPSAEQWIETYWQHEVMPSLADYVRIPNKSPHFDPDWEANGYMEQAVQHMADWVNSHSLPGMQLKVHRLPNRTPTILIEIPGSIDDTVLLYGHLDKQPEFVGWHEGLSPWEPVIKDDKLYGRGGADDGYAIYSSIAAIQLLQTQKIAHPKIFILIEASEESGSPDLPHYMNELETIIGSPSLVIALDSTAGNYDQMWVTTSLRGIMLANLKVQVLEQGAHSGMAGGIVSSSFRVLRSLLSRIENEDTGEIKPDFLQAQIPPVRRKEAEYAAQVLGNDFDTMFTFAGDGKPLTQNSTELVLNNTWRASLAITGADGLPSPEEAGNVLRPYTTAKLSLRIPPTADPETVAAGMKNLIEENPPNGAKVEFDFEHPSPGWHAPLSSALLQEAMDGASEAWFGLPSVSIGCGGSIPFMEFLANKYPKAEFVVTGVLGPHSNAHGPNEFLHLPTVKKITGCVASIIEKWTDR